MKMPVLIPRGVWQAGKRICDGMFTMETVFLRTFEAIKNGEEPCHHITVSVVGPPAAGKTSLIRKLAGLEIQPEHIPTQLMDTQVLRPVEENEVKPPVEETVIRVDRWEIVEQKTDTDELISNHVEENLNRESAQNRGAFFPVKMFLLIFISIISILTSVARTSTLFTAMLVNVFSSWLLLGFHDTGMRIGFGLSVGPVVAMLFLAHHTDSCEEGIFSWFVCLKLFVQKMMAAAMWGILTGLGWNPGMAAGLAIMRPPSAYSAVINSLYENTTEVFTGLVYWSDEKSICVLLFWFCVGFAILLGYSLGNLAKDSGHKTRLMNNIKCTAMLSVVALRLCMALQARSTDTHAVYEFEYIYLMEVFLSFCVGILSLQLGRLPGYICVHEPVLIELRHIYYNLLCVDVIGICVGVSFGYFGLGWTASISSIQEISVNVVLLIFLLGLCKACPTIYLVKTHLQSEAKLNRSHKKEMKTTDSIECSRLHRCFKLLVRDFAGQEDYYCIHQPFIPKFGIFLCVFNWEDADRKPDECLDLIVFWLKNIYMHRSQKASQFMLNTSKPQTRPSDEMDSREIKNVFLVGTHKRSIREEKRKSITEHYINHIKNNHLNLFSLLSHHDRNRIISIDNTDGVTLKILKKCLYVTSKELSRCFPPSLPLSFWCWLKEVRQKSTENRTMPFTTLQQCQKRYGNDFRGTQFVDMFDLFSDIGEILLFPSDSHEHFVIFFDIQFLIDFSKGLFFTEENSVSVREEYRQMWMSLTSKGFAKKALLDEYLKEFCRKYSWNEDKQCDLLLDTLRQLGFLHIADNVENVSYFVVPQLLRPRPEHMIAWHMDQMKFEFIFDFKNSYSHHEFVFFRLVSQTLTKYPQKNPKKCVFRDWASFKVTTSGFKVTTYSREECFNISCVRQNQRNMIILQVQKDVCTKKSLEIKQFIRGAVQDIKERSFPKLKLDCYYNCPNRREPSSVHRISETAAEIDCSKEPCIQDRQIRVIMKDEMPVKLTERVTEEMVDWLKAPDQANIFPQLMSKLTGTSEKRLKFLLTSENALFEKTDVLEKWLQGGDEPQAIETLYAALEGTDVEACERFAVKFLRDT